jgi:hypothetical protein
VRAAELVGTQRAVLLGEQLPYGVDVSDGGRFDAHDTALLVGVEAHAASSPTPMPASTRRLSVHEDDKVGLVVLLGAFEAGGLQPARSMAVDGSAAFGPGGFTARLVAGRVAQAAGP